MKKLLSLVTVIVMIAALTIGANATPAYNWNLMENDFAAAADYDANGNANSGIKSNVFVKQSATTPCELKTDNGVTYISIPSQDTGNAQLVGTFYNTLDAKDISSQASANLSVVFQVRFRAAEGTKGVHFRLGSSAYRTILDVYTSSENNLVVTKQVPSDAKEVKILKEGVNDGNWHVLTVAAKYTSTQDSIAFDIDGTEVLTGKFSEYILRTDAPAMTILVLKEAASDAVDIDYIKVSDGTIDTTTTTAADTTSSNTTSSTTTSSTTTSASTGDTSLALVVVLAAVIITGSVIVINRRKQLDSE